MKTFQPITPPGLTHRNLTRAVWIAIFCITLNGCENEKDSNLLQPLQTEVQKYPNPQKWLEMKGLDKPKELAGKDFIIEYEAVSPNGKVYMLRATFKV